MVSLSGDNHASACLHHPFVLSILSIVSLRLVQ